MDATPQSPGAHLEGVLAIADSVRHTDSMIAALQGFRRHLLTVGMNAVRQDATHSGGSTEVHELASIIAAELRLSDRTVEAQMVDAWTLVNNHPKLHEAAAEYRFTPAHLRVIEEVLEPLTRAVDDAITDEDRDRASARLDRVTDKVIELAETTTPGSLRRRARRLVDSTIAAPLQTRRNIALQDRNVRMSDAGDGMCHLIATIPAIMGAAIMDRLTQGANQKPDADPRNFHQFRADAFTTILIAGKVDGDVDVCQQIRPIITVTIPATELAREDGTPTTPASLNGHVLVDTDTVRRLAVDAPIWERLFTHPVSGVAVATDTYRPTAEQRRWARLRDGFCRWEGCTVPAVQSDLDHTQDFALGGATSIHNLAHLCRRHHRMKHTTDWTPNRQRAGSSTGRHRPESAPRTRPNRSRVPKFQAGLPRWTVHTRSDELGRALPIALPLNAVSRRVAARRSSTSGGGGGGDRASAG